MAVRCERARAQHLKTDQHMTTCTAAEQVCVLVRAGTFGMGNECCGVHCNWLLTTSCILPCGQKLCAFCVNKCMEQPGERTSVSRLKSHLHEDTAWNSGLLPLIYKLSRVKKHRKCHTTHHILELTSFCVDIPVRCAEGLRTCLLHSPSGLCFLVGPVIGPKQS